MALQPTTPFPNFYPTTRVDSFSVAIGARQIAIPSSYFSNYRNQRTVCLTDPSHIYIISRVTNSLLFATNHTGSWVQNYFTGANNYGYYPIGIDCFAPGIVHVAYTDATPAYSTPTNVLFRKSVNGGTTWDSAVTVSAGNADGTCPLYGDRNALNSFSVNDVALTFNSNNASGDQYQHFARSINGGVNWILSHVVAAADLHYDVVVTRNQINAEIMYVTVQSSASVESGIYRTTNGGANWARVQSDNYNWGIAIGPVNNHMAVENSSALHLWKSADNGASWALVIPGHVATDCYSSYHWLYHHPVYDGVALLIYLKAPYSTQTFVITTTVDGGATWVKQGEIVCGASLGNQWGIGTMSRDGNYGVVLAHSYSDKNVYAYPLTFTYT